MWVTSVSDWQADCIAHIGKTEQCIDELSAYPARCIQATLNEDSVLKPGSPLPALFHWLYFNEPAKASNLKTDGHAKLGGFLPPVKYPRRMWAGSRVKFHHSLIIGEATVKKSQIQDVQFKTGASGPLCFVTVDHQYYQSDLHCLSEQQTIVYRDASNLKTNNHPQSTVTKQCKTGLPHFDSITLFRYSALTFNSHRIHYDRNYAFDQENYPGLVVHGPLMATLLIQQACNNFPDKTLDEFSFRVQSPLFENEGYEVQIQENEYGLTMALVKFDSTQIIAANLKWQL